MNETAPQLRQRSPSSFEIIAGHPDCMVQWLADRGFQAIAPRSTHEIARLRTRHGQLVVIYYTGVVLVQGTDPAATIELLDQLTERQGVLL